METLAAHAEPPAAAVAEPIRAVPVITDTFAEPLGPGHVVGSSTADGSIRGGHDAEAVLSIDGGALRISPLERPAWGRSALSYGRLTAEPGLAMATVVLNGHQASQSYSLRRLLPRLGQWLHGSGTRSGVARLRRCLTEDRRLSALARIRGWARRTGDSDSPIVRRLPALRRLRTPPGDEPAILDNLVVGFLAGEAATGPGAVAAGLGIRSTDNLNGALGPVVGGTVAGIVDRLTAVPLGLVTIVRDGSTLHAASWPATAGGDGPPAVSPIAVGPPPSSTVVHPAVQQNISGEIGFSIDTRVFDLRVVRAPGLASWCAGAHLADDLTGSGPLTATLPSAGPAWAGSGGSLSRGAHGAVATTGGSSITADPRHPSGLIRIVAAPGAPMDAAVLWRVVDTDRHLRLVVSDGRWCLLRRDGSDVHLAGGELPGGSEAIQVRDDGSTVTVVAGTAVVASVAVAGPDGTGVGLESLTDGPLGVVRIEALPRALVLPAELQPPAVPVLDEPGRLVFQDRFDRPTPDLSGTSPDGVRTWRRRIGTGRIAVTAAGRAEIVEAAGRSAWTVEWPEPRFADLTATITPVHRPGSQARAGLIAVQGPDDYLAVNLWFNDRADGAASVSSFFMIDGHEDVYDAVWVNVEDRIRWDTEVRLRLAFDGTLYQVWLDDELVLWRRISDVYPATPPLDIRHVGLLSNWEWGLDTGSHFGSFAARGPAR